MKIKDPIKKELAKITTPPKPDEFANESFFLVMKRILTNKLLMINITGGCFYIISASAFMSFFAKYLEVQFGTAPGGGTLVTGKSIFYLPQTFID